METSELRLVLESCITPAQLKSFLQGTDGGGDLYESAAAAILDEDESGARIAKVLDVESARQRKKIESMPVGEIRASLSPEFLEPGKTLGLIVWSLLRDSRMGARNMASEIADYFMDDGAPGVEPAAEFGPDSASASSRVSMIEEIDDMGEDDIEQFIDDTKIEVESSSDEEDDSIPDIDFASIDMIDESDSDDDDIDIDNLLSELSDEDDEPDPISDLVEDELEEPDFGDLDALLAEDDDEVDEDHALEIPDGQLMGDREMSGDDADDLDSLMSALEENSLAAEESDPDINLDDLNLHEEPSPEELYGKPITDEAFAEVDEVLQTPGKPSSIHAPKRESAEPLVALGGVEIALSSLKRACEKVFEEPIELVTDDNLTQEDKVVVVGKHCGVKVLYGPHYSIHTPASPRDDMEEPVTVSPVSLQAALTKVFGETVEIVPDPELLNVGIITFTGRDTGIEVLRNSKLCVPLPPWVNAELESAIEAAASAETKSAELANQVQGLEDRIARLESAPRAAAPAPEPIAAPKPEPEPEPEPEPDVEPEGDVSATAMSMDEIETEELEPVIEPDDGAMDDLDALISGSDSADEDEADEDGGADDDADDDIGELNLDDLDLGMDDDDGGDASDDDGDEELDLDELDLDSLAEEMGDVDLSDGDDEDEGDDDDSSDDGDEEINLDDLDLNLDDLDESDDDPEPKMVLNGEMVLLLGGEEKNQSDYLKVIEEIGGVPEWYGQLEAMNEGEIAEMVERSDIIMTLSSDAVADPGILQATNVAQENNKRVFSHHSANPKSVQKQMMKLVEEGKI